MTMTPSSEEMRDAAERLFAGPGELRALCRAHDWSTTPLGPVATWSSSLRTAVQLVLAHPFPNVVLWGPDLAQIYNDGYRSLMGGKHPAGLGQPTRLCWPEVWHINEPIYERVWRGESVALEDALFPITRSGVREDAWFTLSYTPVRSDDGDIGGVLVTVFETTKRRRAETLVRETEARFHTFASDSTDALDRMSADWSEQRQLADRLRASEAVQQRILESSGAGLWELDFATGAIAADARMVELMGLPPGGTFDLASGLNEQVVPEDRERVGAAVAAAMAGENDGRYLVEFRTGGRDGVPLRWVESRARVTFDAAGKARSLGGAMVDITARKSAEAALHASEDRYRMLFESLDEGCCLIEVLFDAQGRPFDYRFLETNASFEAQTGLRDAQGRTIREMAPAHEQFWFDLYGHVVTSGEPVRTESRAEALGRWFTAYASRVGTAEQRQVIVLFNDITHQKQLEAERERLLALETDARRLAEEASRLKDEFIATVSHELRTPLTSMLGWVQMLRAGTVPPERRERALETVERNARSQAQLIDDLLDMSRILSGKLRLEVESLDLVPLVEEAIDTARPAASARGVRLQSRIAPCGAVAGDPQRLQQVIWNLLSNAVKFTPRGGQVLVAMACHDATVEISVTDTGQGMSAVFLPHVFERFRQAEGSITRTHGGLGLGLSIVKHLVELHGGTVSAFSEGEGHGSRFTVRLPVASAGRHEEDPSSVPSSGGEAAPASNQLAGLRLLVVDDDEDARSMLTVLLESHGARVQTAASVAEARRRFESAPPDLVVSDIGMPHEDGYALVAWLRARPVAAGGEVPAIALTAYARSQDRAHALQAGFDSHVAKPIDPVELLAVLTRLTRHRLPGRT